MKNFRRVAVVGLGLLLAGVLLAIWVRQPRAVVAVPLPNPNAYDDFLKGGALVVSATGDYRTNDLPALQALVASNAPALALVRAGLRKECLIPAPSYDEAALSNHLELYLAPSKGIARALAADARLAELKQQPGAAAAACLDGLEFSQAAFRGGLLIDRLVAVACEAIAVQPLSRLVPQLSAAECREAARRLEAILARREPLAKCIQRERGFMRSQPGFQAWITALVTRGMTEQAIQRGIGKAIAQQNVTRQVLLDLASRAYELEHGHLPASSAELVPGYLQAIPPVANLVTNRTQ